MQAESSRGRRRKRGSQVQPVMESKAETAAQRDENKQYMVYEEIGVVITTQAFVEEDQILSADSTLYVAVKNFLNARPSLKDFPESWRVPDKDLFQDLVQPSDYLFRDLVPRERRPGVLLKRKNDTGTAILFFKLALSTGIVESKSPAERAQPIRDLAKLLNQLVGTPDGRHAPPDAPPNQIWQIAGASPNWLAAAASDDSGSPAAPPKPGPNPGDAPKKWTFKFENPAHTTATQTALQAQVNARRSADAPSKVVVAILDTCPSTPIDTLAGRFPKNELFKEVAGLAGLNNPVLLAPSTPGLFTHIPSAVPCWLGWLLALFNTPPGAATTALINASYFMPSHGLFSAGIVKDIVPDAKIHLIGVLNDIGMSSQDALAAVFLNLPSLIGSGEHLVVNCSWTTSTLAANTIPQLADDIILDVLIQWLQEQDILVVAAVGNNALEASNLGKPRPGAYYPAAFDGIGNVLSVMATDIAFSGPARYTNNRSNMGVATVGGDAILDANSKSVLEQETTTTLDAIVGIYWEPTLVISGATNTSGWASWAGTSFATPIISAIAAVLWTQKTKDHASDIIAAVQAAADMTGISGLNANTLYARQIVQP